jgi:Derlin-2/3
MFGAAAPNNNNNNNNNNDNGGGAQRAVLDWYRKMPVVTRSFMTGCVLTSLAVYLDVLSAHKLYLRSVSALIESGEYWRLITNFLFFDYFGLNFIFHMFFMVRYSTYLESGSFRGRTADYVYMWLFSALSLLTINFGLAHYGALSRPVFFLAPSFGFAIVYVWGRRNPNFSMSFLYLFHFTAPWLPWVLMLFGFLLGQPPVYDLLGIVVGHLYFFFVDVYPQFSGRHLLATPRFFKRMLGERIEGDDPQPAAAQQQEQADHLHRE